MHDAAGIERLLKDRLARIDDDQAATANERAPVMLDQSRVGRLSRMDALQVQAMAKEQERRRRAERQRIKAALERLSDGTWGLCTECGETIAGARLDFDPTVTLCIRCAREAC
ncbi:MAG: TraR/DksA C4-type zinc finger protein [bacterium]|nr:TraR/DksA C4-type zinc finger protein [bacterium]